MALRKEDVLHIAKLARLELGDADVEKFQNQLSSILEYVDVLQKVKGVEEIKQIHGLHTVVREDAVHPFSEDGRRAMRDQAPEREGDFIKTSGVFESSL